jgi:hypothetical protein
LFESILLVFQKDLVPKVNEAIKAKFEAPPQPTGPQQQQRDEKTIIKSEKVTSPKKKPLVSEKV